MSESRPFDPGDQLTPCQLNDPELWFTNHRSKQAKAKEFCHGCELRQQCLDQTIQFELEHGGAGFGLYAGLTRAERNKLIKKNRPAN